MMLNWLFFRCEKDVNMYCTPYRAFILSGIEFLLPQAKVCGEATNIYIYISKTPKPVTLFPI